jgi:hypothetical protein
MLYDAIQWILLPAGEYHNLLTSRLEKVPKNILLNRNLILVKFGGLKN